MTANVLPEQVRAFREAGMDDHVAKPFKQQDLHDAIRRALSRGRVSVDRRGPDAEGDLAKTYRPAA
jgi:FixJ family two-component response regulator